MEQAKTQEIKTFIKWQCPLCEKLHSHRIYSYTDSFVKRCKGGIAEITVIGLELAVTRVLKRFKIKEEEEKNEN